MRNKIHTFPVAVLLAALVPSLSIYLWQLDRNGCGNSFGPPEARRQETAAGRDPRVPEELPGTAKLDVSSTAMNSARTHFDYNLHEAASQAELLAPGLDRQNAMRTVARDWAQISPEAALDWANRLPDQTESREVMEFALYRVAEDAPEVALKLAIEAGFSTGSPPISDLTRQWAEADFIASKNWCLNQPPGEKRDQLVVGISQVLARVDPQEASRLVLESVDSTSWRNDALLSVIHQWARLDLKSATDWVKQFPPGDVREVAEEELGGMAGLSED